MNNGTLLIKSYKSEYRKLFTVSFPDYFSLQVLKVNLLGHRKRIIASLADRPYEEPPQKPPRFSQLRVSLFIFRRLDHFFQSVLRAVNMSIFYGSYFLFTNKSKPLLGNTFNTFLECLNTLGAR